MKKWTLVDEAKTPDGKRISLHEHDGEFTVRIDGNDLMSTRKHASEEKLALLGCAHLKNQKKAKVLIGGLGFGFTLRATLSCLLPDAAVVVAEIMPSIIAWNKNPEFPLAADVLANPQVQVVQKDVGSVIQSETGRFDAILLDVDNGPDALSVDSNERLYQKSGLVLSKKALKKGGCLAIWSASDSPQFAKLMTGVGFNVDVQRARAHTNSGAWHTLFLGRVV